ncbi:hypothetical protein [Sorangium sp. So ce131]|uniref:hypothetical protein n=1 Tax=Sorangium sp. So ce131 TaxID=3133282 RepID=UPI003F6022B0
MSQHAALQRKSETRASSASSDNALLRRPAIVETDVAPPQATLAESAKRPAGEPLPGRDFSRVPAVSAQTGAGSGAAALDQTPSQKKVEMQAHSGWGASRTANTKAISASGAGTVTTTYTPEGKDKSTKIVFIQVMRELLDGKPAKPSESDVDFSYQDADTTGDFYHVDYVAGEKDPYYNGDDTSDFGPQGNALTGTAASTNDTPHYDDAGFPGTSSTLLYEFRTAAFSAAGEDAGTYYGYADWTYTKEKGKPEATAVTGTASGAPGAKFDAAVSLFNSNHGFTMPGKGGLGTLATLGIVLGSLAGAAGIGVGIAAAAGAFSNRRKGDQAAPTERT